MKVRVRLFGAFRQGRFRDKVLDLEAGITPSGVMEILGIDAGKAGIIMVNSRHASLDRVLSEGDILAVFPAVGGG